jgi:RimJ/RimL family protein N-acetyltransferase
MRLLIGQDRLVAQWVAARIPKMAEHGLADFGPSTAIGVLNGDGDLIGGVVYHNWQPAFRTIELSFASTTPRWLTKTLITALLAYPFKQLDCARVSALTPRKAASARAFLDQFGFVREGVHWRAFGDDDAISSCLKRKDWERHRYNLERVVDGQERAPTPNAHRSHRRRRRPKRREQGHGPVQLAAGQR